ncbi:RNA polymerase sigma factor SigY [Alkalihalobacillus macyae]|uniref:RNA polymerase sigma factor SigY n=1 Tax=Guptibacillus hwajinpoensis TaxID=208199 RepID=UPI00273C7D1B|nr:RNA polymerase sigma factor SigY [Alkalihalobacillus macyae]MDP4549664.1 RNA polymerase sigma factor SigY [Alkalihalobacillus macyae]
MEREEEIQLIQQAQAGDDQAFTQLFQSYYAFLYRYLLKLTLNEETSDDLAQETMMKCYLKLSSYKGESKFSTWVISIASRLYIDMLRKQKREKKWVDEEKRSLSRKLSWNSSTKGLVWSDLFADFNTLESTVRVPILLRHYYGYSYEEIGNMLGIRTGTVKSRVHTGLQKLRKELDES